MKTALVDGDMVAWFLAFGGNRFGERAESYVAKVLRDTKSARAILCFSDQSQRYFRHDLFPTYKTRKDDRRPAGYRDAVELLKADYISRELPTLEADDVMGIIATYPTLSGGDFVIVSDDKDLFTIPGLHYNPRKPGIKRIELIAADVNHLYQTLTGDTSDTYPGCKGIGPKAAAAILKDGPNWGAVVAAFESKGFTEADALLQARIARILRTEDYDIETKSIRLWNPKPANVAA